MLTQPWTTTGNVAATPSTVIAGRLPLRSHRDLPAALMWAQRTQRHLATTPGVGGYATSVDLSPALWIVSAWTNRDDLVRFEHSTDHYAAQQALRLRLRPATFVVWTCPTADLPVTWAEVRRRIAVATSMT
jgi:hypothetical protein